MTSVPRMNQKPKSDIIYDRVDEDEKQDLFNFLCQNQQGLIKIMK